MATKKEPSAAPTPSRPAARSANTPGHPSITSRITSVFRHKAAQLLIVFVIGLLPTIYLYHQNQQLKAKLNPPNPSSLQTTAAVVKQVSKHILLPTGEQPTVATVTDASKVRNQAFFENSASGDKVLIYAQAKKAYLYRPSIDRVIEVAPLAPASGGNASQSGQ